MGLEHRLAAHQRPPQYADQGIGPSNGTATSSNRQAIGKRREPAAPPANTAPKEVPAHIAHRTAAPGSSSQMQESPAGPHPGARARTLSESEIAAYGDTTAEQPPHVRPFEAIMKNEEV